MSCHFEFILRHQNTTYGLVTDMTDHLNMTRWSRSRNFPVISPQRLKSQRQASDKSVTSPQARWQQVADKPTGMLWESLHQVVSCHSCCITQMWIGPYTTITTNPSNDPNSVLTWNETHQIQPSLYTAVCLPCINILCISSIYKDPKPWLSSQGKRLPTQQNRLDSCWDPNESLALSQMSQCSRNSSISQVSMSVWASSNVEEHKVESCLTRNQFSFLIYMQTINYLNQHVCLLVYIFHWEHLHSYSLWQPWWYPSWAEWHLATMYASDQAMQQSLHHRRYLVSAVVRCRDTEFDRHDTAP